MVTRIYTPYAATLVRPGRRGSAPETDTTPGEEPGTLPAVQTRGIPLQGGSGFDAGGAPSQGLTAIRQDLRASKIQITSILTDFQSTMQALGADDTTRSEVAAYLNGIAMQARKETPDVPFIKQSLRTAANTLDQYITQALGSPSHVVKEWVDALLMQPIDYHNPEAGTENGATITLSDTETSNNPPTGTNKTAAASLSTEERNGVKALTAQAKAQQQAGNPDAAQASLQEALALTDGKQRPDVEGRLLAMMGRFLDQTGKPNEALARYEAAGDKFAQSGQKSREAQVRYAMASIYDEQGQAQQAEQHYRQVIALDEATSNALGLSRTWNDLGSLQLRQSQAQDAIRSFRQAHTHLLQTGSSPPDETGRLKGDILSNLAAAYRNTQAYPDAIAAYRLSLKSARQVRDRDGYRQSLAQLAATYAEAGQPQNAQKALTQLNAFSANRQPA